MNRPGAPRTRPLSPDPSRQPAVDALAPARLRLVPDRRDDGSCRDVRVVLVPELFSRALDVNKVFDCLSVVEMVVRWFPKDNEIPASVLLDADRRVVSPCLAHKADTLLVFCERTNESTTGQMFQSPRHNRLQLLRGCSPTACRSHFVLSSTSLK